MPRTRSQRNAQRNAMGSICSASKKTSSCDDNTPKSTNKAISDTIHKQDKNASTKRSSSSKTNGNMAKKAKKIPSKSKKSRRKPKLPPAEALFIEFASHGEDVGDDDPNEIGIEGVGVMCEKLGLEIDDVRVMVLLWKLGSKAKPQSITKEEFLKGCKTLDVDSIPKFKKLLPSLDLGFLDRDDFRGMYQFCFRFNLEGTHKTLCKNLVVDLWKITLKGRIPNQRLDTFCSFVESQETYSRITLDQWTSFLDFSYECEDLSSYDESASAWPVLIDEYVEHMEEQEKKTKNAKKSK